MLMYGRESLIGLWKTYLAGEIPVAASGVLRYCMIAFVKLSVSKLPFGLVLSISRRFIELTATSALPLLRACATDDILWCIPQFCSIFFVDAAVNSGPPSLDISSGTPNVWMMSYKELMRPVAPSLACLTTGHPENLSTVIRYDFPL